MSHVHELLAGLRITSNRIMSMGDEEGYQSFTDYLSSTFNQQNVDGGINGVPRSYVTMDQNFDSVLVLGGILLGLVKNKLHKINTHVLPLIITDKMYVETSLTKINYLEFTPTPPSGVTRTGEVTVEKFRSRLMPFSTGIVSEVFGSMTDNGSLMYYQELLRAMNSMVVHLLWSAYRALLLGDPIYNVIGDHRHNNVPMKERARRYKEMFAMFNLSTNGFIDSLVTAKTFMGMKERSVYPDYCIVPWGKLESLVILGANSRYGEGGPDGVKRLKMGIRSSDEHDGTLRDNMNGSSFVFHDVEYLEGPLLNTHPGDELEGIVTRVYTGGHYHFTVYPKQDINRGNYTWYVYDVTRDEAVPISTDELMLASGWFEYRLEPMDINGEQVGVPMWGLKLPDRNRFTVEDADLLKPFFEYNIRERKFEVSDEYGGAARIEQWMQKIDFIGITPMCEYLMESVCYVKGGEGLGATLQSSIQQGISVAQDMRRMMETRIDIATGVHVSNPFRMVTHRDAVYAGIGVGNQIKLIQPDQWETISKNRFNLRVCNQQNNRQPRVGNMYVLFAPRRSSVVGLDSSHVYHNPEIVNITGIDEDGEDDIDIPNIKMFSRCFGWDALKDHGLNNYPISTHTFDQQLQYTCNGVMYTKPGRGLHGSEGPGCREVRMYGKKHNPYQIV